MLRHPQALDHIGGRFLLAQSPLSMLTGQISRNLAACVVIILLRQWMVMLGFWGKLAEETLDSRKMAQLVTSVITQV